MARNTAPMPFNWRRTLTRESALIGERISKVRPVLDSNRSTAGFGMISYCGLFDESAVSLSA